MVCDLQVVLLSSPWFCDFLGNTGVKDKDAQELVRLCNVQADAYSVMASELQVWFPNGSGSADHAAACAERLTAVSMDLRVFGYDVAGWSSASQVYTDFGRALRAPMPTWAFGTLMSLYTVKRNVEELLYDELMKKYDFALSSLFPETFPQELVVPCPECKDTGNVWCSLEGLMACKRCAAEALEAEDA